MNSTTQNKPTTEQPKPKKQYLQLSPKQLEKLAKFKEQQKGIEVDPEWLEIAEFGGYFGYAGIEAILNNKIDREVVQMLIAGQRKVWASHVLDHAQASFVGAVSAKHKRPGSAFKKAIKGFVERMRVEK